MDIRFAKVTLHGLEGDVYSSISLCQGIVLMTTAWFLFLRDYHDGSIQGKAYKQVTVQTVDRGRKMFSVCNSFYTINGQT